MKNDNSDWKLALVFGLLFLASAAVFYWLTLQFLGGL